MCRCQIFPHPGSILSAQVGYWQNYSLTIDSSRKATKWTMTEDYFTKTSNNSLVNKTEQYKSK